MQNEKVNINMKPLLNFNQNFEIQSKGKMGM